MADDIFSGITIPDEEIPQGHFKRFSNKLDSLSRVRNNLKIIQRIAIAASVAAFLILSSIVALNLEDLKTQKTALYGISAELYETELYYTGAIEEKMEILTSSSTFDKEILNDIREIDKSFNEVRKELIRNPNDDRLISAVIETYRIKLDLLDEVLSKSAYNKI